jgi:hypothetical protein
MGFGPETRGKSAGKVRLTGRESRLKRTQIPRDHGHMHLVWRRRIGRLTFLDVGAIGAVVARFVHTEEVTGSNPVSPTPTGGSRPA